MAGKGQVISSRTLLGMWLLSMLDLKLIHVGKSGTVHNVSYVRQTLNFIRVKNMYP